MFPKAVLSLSLVECYMENSMTLFCSSKDSAVLVKVLNWPDVGTWYLFDTKCTLEMYI